MQLTTRVLVALALCCAGCGDSTTTPTPNPSDAGVQDMGNTGDTDVDSDDTRDVQTPDADTPDADPEPRPRTALIVDYEMRPAIVWSAVLTTLTDAGWAPEYRRWYPHITPADSEAYGLIVVASGRAPSTPAARMRAAELDHLEAFARAGGALVLLPEAGWADAAFAENEWFFFNRLLERLELPIRSARATLIGAVWPPEGDAPPLHVETLDSYPGSLEWTLDLPVAYPTTLHPGITQFATPFAAGWVPPLVCDSDDIAVLAGARLEVTVWHTLAEGSGQLSFPSSRVPLAALGLGPAGAPVLVLPASIALLPSHTERQSDEPMLDPALLRGTGTFVRRALSHTLMVSDDASRHDPLGGCHFDLGDGVFSAVAQGFPALNRLAKTVPALVRVSEVPVPDNAPAGQFETLAEPVETAADPSWFRGGKAYIGYGDWDPTLADRFANGAAHGLDAYMISVPPAWLYDDDPRVGELAQAAQDEGVELFVGTIAISLFSQDDRTQAIRPRGRNGQVVDVPSPVTDLFWDGALRPFVLGAATAAAAHPGIRGVQLDLELYGAGPLNLHRGHLVGDAEWAVIAGAVDGAAGVALDERLAWLVDNGKMAAATGALRDAVAARARQLREDARAIHPDLAFLIYSLDATTGWFYEGLMQGLGTAQRPVTWLTYDLFTSALRRDLAARDIHVRLVGGVLGVRLTPEDLGTALTTVRTESDGYWLFKLQDFPTTSDHPDAARLHGAAEDYWDEVGRASAP